MHPFNDSGLKTTLNKLAPIVGPLMVMVPGRPTPLEVPHWRTNASEHSVQ